MNFVYALRILVLMQNGKYDYLLPWKTAIEPLFELLGTPDRDKRLIAYEGGHPVWFLGEYRRDIFDFLDKHLGPPNR